MVDTIKNVRRGVQHIGSRVSAAQLASNTAASTNLRPIGASDLSQSVNMRRHYEMLELYAANNALYDAMLQANWERGKALGDVRGLMTPANALSQVYASTVWPGTLPEALPIVANEPTELEALKEASEAVYDSSNWGTNKQVTIRHGIRLGDVFLKACQREDGFPFIQVIHPWYVSDFDTNERGHLTFIRLDLPQDSESADGRTMIETEVWDKEAGTYRLWQHFEAIDAELDKLGTPDIEDNYFSYGFDFIPFVHIKARDIGEKYGQAPIVPALDKIDELNILATELNDDLFRHNRAKYVVSSNLLDAEGRPMLPPNWTGIADTSGFKAIVEETQGEEYFVLPGMAAMNALGSGIDWTARISVRDGQYDALVRTDLPELKWYTLTDAGTLSGVALRRIMAPAVSAIVEARGNFESGLIKAKQMAFTLGKIAGVEPFNQITAWEDGGMRFNYAERDVIPSSEEERAESDMKRQQANALMISNGYTIRWVMEHVDKMDKEDVDEMLAEELRVSGPSVDEDIAGVMERTRSSLRAGAEPNLAQAPDVSPPRPGEVAS